MSDHEFSFYYPDLSETVQGESPLLEIQDSAIIHRLIHVLRIKKDDRFILFNEKYHVHCLLQTLGRNSLSLLVRNITPNVSYRPTIFLGLPLLKKQALEEAVYSATEAGVSGIQLLLTEKIHRAWGGEKEKDRLRKIIIAAAEQSKNFAIPSLLLPIPLEQFLIDAHEPFFIFCDPEGEAFSKVLTRYQAQAQKNIKILIGPEGDLSANEKKFLKDQKVAFVHLTPTILRAQQVAGTSVVLLRTML